MSKTEARFEDFLNDISPEYAGVVSGLHNFLIDSGCAVKLQLAKSGYTVSYTDAKTKGAAANFVSRKKGPVIRIYGNNADKYLDFLEGLPEWMISSIEKAPSCKRLLDPEKCNSRCPKGYTLTIKNNRHQKCRYNCFMFSINNESFPYIKDFLEREIRERSV